MDRNVTIASVIVLILVALLFVWGWRKVIPVSPAAAVASPTSVSVAPIPLPTAAVLTQAAPAIAPTPDTSYWVMDDALLATRSLDDLFLYQKENDRPQIGLPNGVTRNDHGLTPKQSEMQLDGYIVAVPDAARVDILDWGSDDLAHVRVREGKKAGATGWINKHLLRQIENGVYVPAFPVDIK